MVGAGVRGRFRSVYKHGQVLTRLRDETIPVNSGDTTVNALLSAEVMRLCPTAEEPEDPRHLKYSVDTKKLARRHSQFCVVSDELRVIR